VTSAAHELPSDPDALRVLALQQQQEIDTRDAKIDAQAAQIRQLEEYVRLLRHQRFGRTSEQTSRLQLGLFNEAEVAADAAEKEDAPDGVEVAAHTRRPHGRRPLPAFLPRVEIVHDLPEAEKVCAADGTALVRIGEEVCEQLEIIPATIRVLRHVRPKYACPGCHTGIRVAALPPQPIPKSLASPALLAHVAVAKYVDALPLHRQETILGRIGIELPRATLASWMVRAGELVQPLVNLLRDELLAGGLAQCDESPFQVLKEPGKAATSLSYLWAQRSLARGAPVVLFDYDPSRSGRVPERLFEGFEGVIQTDGYEGYTAVGQRPGIVHVGCWAHARRKFDATPEERTRLRAERSRPVVEALRRWLDDACRASRRRRSRARRSPISTTNGRSSSPSSTTAASRSTPISSRTRSGPSSSAARTGSSPTPSAAPTPAPTSTASSRPPRPTGSSPTPTSATSSPRSRAPPRSPTSRPCSRATSTHPTCTTYAKHTQRRNGVRLRTVERTAAETGVSARTRRDRLRALCTALDALVVLGRGARLRRSVGPGGVTAWQRRAARSRTLRRPWPGRTAKSRNPRSARSAKSLRTCCACSSRSGCRDSATSTCTRCSTSAAPPSSIPACPAPIPGARSRTD
jgi:transposase